MTSPPPSDEPVIKSKEKSKKFNFMKYGEVKFIILFIIVFVVIRIFFKDEFDNFLIYFEGFNMMNQFLIPVLFGGLGGYCYIIMSSLSSTYNREIPHASKKFTFIGSVAGVAAVNLLNPSGSVSQVLILSLIAGLSGISYLKRNALVDSQHEDSILDKEKLKRPSLKSEQNEHQNTSPINETLTKSQMMLKILEEQKNK